jgi:CTP:molybdopterin cytidylyltransferase MocA
MTKDRTPMSERKFRGVPAVILAGGRSVRMGRIKALLPWPPHGRPCVIHVMEQLRDAGAGPVAVVTGAHHDAIAGVVGDRAAVLFNARHDEGQLASLQCGLDWAFAVPDAAWALVTLVDLPGISAATMREVLAAAAGSEALAVRPVIGDQHGHPVLWRREAWPLVQAANPAGGARQVMRQLAATGRVLDVAVDDEAVLRDIDTPQDYQEQVKNQKSEGRSQKGG